MSGLEPLIIAAIGVGAAGTATSVYASSQQNKYNQKIAREQERENRVRQQQMEADARRRRLEVIRNQQRARAAALAAATNQGAIAGSGLQGGYGQIGGQTAVNIEGINQNLGFGDQLFAIDSRINSLRSSQSDYAALGAIGGGLTSLGNSFMSGASAYGRLSQTGGYNPQNYYTPSVYAYNSFGNYGIY